MAATETLEANNWKQAAIAAINELPKNLQLLVGHRDDGDDKLAIVVLCEPHVGDDDEEGANGIVVQYWPSLRQKGWPEEFDDIYGPGGLKEKQAEWPVVSITGDALECEQALFVGRADLRSFQGEVKNAILQTLHNGGGRSVVGKDDDDDFVSDDGSKILAEDDE